VALGISAIGDISEMGHKNKKSDSGSPSSDEKDSTPTGVKISTAAGVFMLVALSVSLFFASLIAVKLSLISSNLIGFTLGMVIWAGTLLLAVYFDSKLISALTGTIFGAIKDTLSAGASTVGNIFSQSEKGQAKTTAQETVKAKAESAIQNWFDRMDQPELEYDRLRQDVEHMMDDPKAAPGILRNRLRNLDRESLIALLSNNKRITHEQAEKAVTKIEEARDSVISKTEEIERKVTIKLNELKQDALNQAEATRKTAATAAWWFFIAAVVSGGASVLGGILAFTF